MSRKILIGDMITFKKPFNHSVIVTGEREVSFWSGNKEIILLTRTVIDKEYCEYRKTHVEQQMKKGNAKCYQ